MRALWKGSISFGLVNIPVSLVNASKTEELRFKLLRQTDLSPVNYKRVAQADGKEVPWEQIVKGYEYEKGKFVVLKEEDFQRVDLEATDTIDIIDFVKTKEINPVFFYKPYYMQPGKGGGAAYELLRSVLESEQKVGIAKVVIRTRQHLAAVKPNGERLVLELMRFEDELIQPEEVTIEKSRAPRSNELNMARLLVEQMTGKWDPSKYNDDYRSAMMKLIKKKVEAGGKELPDKARQIKKATNVIDLAEVLKQSLSGAGSSSNSSASAKKASRPAKKSAKKKTTKGRKRAA